MPVKLNSLKRKIPCLYQVLIKFISNMTNSSDLSKRGALIVFEGCDGAGKTTQCKRLVEHLNNNGHKAKYMNFPNRDTACGSLINSYLTNKQDLPDESIHLLFTFNRWEVKNHMAKLLSEGTTLIVDRYSYSGVAYSAAKGLDYEWCKAPEKGLLKPDLVIFLSLMSEAAAKRNGFGLERYETITFQQKVYDVFQRMKDDDWVEINADNNEKYVLNEIIPLALQKIDTVKGGKFRTLW